MFLDSPLIPNVPPIPPPDTPQLMPIWFVLVVLGGFFIFWGFVWWLELRGCCWIGLHKWRFFKSQKYPEYYRICGNCGRTEELLYDMLTFSWERNPTRPWLASGDVEITNKNMES